MGYNERTIGGGPAKGLAKDFTGFLQNFINTGSFGGGTAGQQTGAANPTGKGMDVFSLLNSIVSNPSADTALQGQLAKTQERNVNQLRSRFGVGGGTAFGSPASTAEAQYRAEAAPQEAIALDQLARDRLGALMPFFQQAFGISGMGIPQAETVLQPSGALQAINIATDIGKTAANFIPGGSVANAALDKIGSPTANVTKIGLPTNPAVRTPVTSVNRRMPAYDFQQLYN